MGQDTANAGCSGLGPDVELKGTAGECGEPAWERAQGQAGWAPTSVTGSLHGHAACPVRRDYNVSRRALRAKGLYGLHGAETEPIAMSPIPHA